MNFYTISHCAGGERVPSVLRTDVEASIEAVTSKPEAGGAKKIRDDFLTALKSHGWSDEFLVSKASDMTITALKNDVGLCLQTGNMARMYADLIKLQTLYLDGAIGSAIIVVPSQPVAALLGSNIAQASRLERELKIFEKAYNVPTLVYALE